MDFYMNTIGDHVDDCYGYDRNENCNEINEIVKVNDNKIGDVVSDYDFNCNYSVYCNSNRNLLLDL